ncbi:TubC N-terminal docking domain-related protein [Mycobacterium avium subsp. paratuberculosis]|uniref:TubC N-terminal docking domain-related protein n=1 Tax=Mycobacterium avium TaxID=1764 RepID=UPI0035A608EF
MTAAELVDHLRGIGVQLWADGENLRYRAPQQVLTADLKAQLAAVKTDVITLLAEETTLLRAPQDRFEPFPLTDVQAAYLVGRTSAFQWGGVGCHGYAEFAVDHTERRAISGGVAQGCRPPRHVALRRSSRGVSGDMPRRARRRAGHPSVSHGRRRCRRTCRGHGTSA